ncbi:hypothetical protein NDN08_002734 [Rhodosorus marinus]|uniref:Tr-type G domain-containing protein n=1 Tax=Rhodosorus marinus TaxID=101924 RepID=A0AAV8UUK5_9RHOD|nr:hypothetical protein NDN08_002734 [Rhodosorus marinus]
MKGVDDLSQDLGLMRVEDLTPEDDEGNMEYKWCLVNPSRERFMQLVTQMNFRLLEGQGEAIYQVGVEDDGRLRGLHPDALEASLHTLKRMASELKAETTVICETAGREGKCAEVLVRQTPESIEDYHDLRVAVAGNVDSGKSTLVGVLTGCGTLDNGRGCARSQMFTHKHELESGRTSCVSQQIMGFSPCGEVINYTGVRTLSWNDVIDKASKVVTFFDLAGHERYLKTTLFGLTAHAPDYCMLLVGANMGVLRMTKEHLSIALALKVPVFVVVTKVDIAPDHVCEQTIQQIVKLFKASRKMPVIVKSEDQVPMAAKNMANDRVVPIFYVSNVTGEGLGNLRSFLNLIPGRQHWAESKNEPTEFRIDETFTVQGVGTVVAGTVTSGSISAGQWLWLGPDSNGKFLKVQIKSLHYKRVPVKRVVAGQAGALAIKKIKRSSVRKGMVLLDLSMRAGAVWSFQAEVVILYHGTTIKEGYQPIVHCVTVRQAAKVMGMETEVIRTGDRARVTFRFMYYPEYVKEGSRFIFREGRTKGIGKITKILDTT